MQRILPETDLERKLMCTAAVFVEENAVLSELYQVIGDTDDPESSLNEIGEYFFRLDMNYGPQIKPDCIEILEDFWRVYDKESALAVLKDIFEQGHRTKFNVMQKSIPSDGALDSVSLEKMKQIFNFDMEDQQEIKMSNEDYTKLAMWVQRTHKYLGEAGILAWDVARAVHLVRLCFIAGYLDDNESWKEILRWAPTIEGKFNDWMGFSQSFLIGRTFWSGVDDPDVKSIAERLLGHPLSPWQFISWT